MRYYFFSLFVAGYLSLASPVHADKIVRWVDQNGVTHFANTPPKGQASVEEVTVQSTNQADVPTKALGTNLRQALAAIERLKTSEKRSDYVIEGPPEHVVTPAARPSEKYSHRRGPARVR